MRCGVAQHGGPTTSSQLQVKPALAERLAYLLDIGLVGPNFLTRSACDIGLGRSLRPGSCFRRTLTVTSTDSCECAPMAWCTWQRHSVAQRPGPGRYAGGLCERLGQFNCLLDSPGQKLITDIDSGDSARTFTSFVHKTELEYVRVASAMLLSLSRVCSLILG
jgi:hypothetical protein